MAKLMFCVVGLLFTFGVICDQVAEDGALQDDWQSDYDNLYEYDFLKEESEKLDSILKSNEDIPVNDLDKKVEEGIKHYGDDSENENAANEDLSLLEDYQLEDDGQKPPEESSKEEIDGKIVEAQEPSENDLKKTASQELAPSNSEEDKENKSKETDANADYALLWGDDDTAPLPLPIAEDDDKIFKETQEILNGEDKDDYGGFEDENQNKDKRVEQEASVEKIIDETKKILSETDNQFEESIPNTEDIGNRVASDAVSEVVNSVEDAKAKELQKELQTLFDTFDNLKDEGSEEPKEKAEDFEDESDSLNVLEYEEKFGKPYREELVLSQRVNPDLDYEVIEDSNLSEIFSKTSVSSNETVDDSIEEFGDKEDNILKTDDNELKSSTVNEKLFEETTTSQPIMYENDALVDDGQRADSADVEEFGVEDNPEEDESNKEKTTTKEPEETKSTEVRQKMVDDLTSSELDDLMEQFAIFHSEDLDVQSDDFAAKASPIHITLSVDEAVEVTSPNYPSTYPTNNVVDWIFEGDGMGIELNITDFAVNGALGDYVLVKPGGVDETGHDGLVFSYRLTSERRYRFTDVNKMFVRFEAHVGMMFFRGFKFSVKLIAPLQEDTENDPESEAVISPPIETLTLHLGGVTFTQFQDIKEQFRALISNMAAEYISENDIDPGTNITSDITQITNTALCNINWPDHENCVSVTFGVPLAYEEEDAEYRLNREDLETMWRTYITRDPFALLLQRLGITEFAMPDESSVMMVWLVIAGGVLISMAMLAFALWRFSCFEDYTRMQAFSDTDSMKNEKRGLDLYPTPHQILPPLYSENDYKWADDSTRVDMGGFANRNYVRDELFDFDSDEEVVPPRDRFTSDV